MSQTQHTHLCLLSPTQILHNCLLLFDHTPQHIPSPALSTTLTCAFYNFIHNLYTCLPMSYPQLSQPLSPTPSIIPSVALPATTSVSFRLPSSRELQVVFTASKPTLQYKFHYFINYLTVSYQLTHLLLAHILLKCLIHHNSILFFTTPNDHYNLLSTVRLIRL